MQSLRWPISSIITFVSFWLPRHDHLELVAIVDLELSNLLERRRVYAELGLLVEQAKEAQMSGALNQDMFCFYCRVFCCIKLFL